ncbi:hypothetical protein NQD34_006655 [Periophthalmus magnuspinnatus]|nr:hypothetical protein NQD34_006655 [Periophthalmus magnuspinnatus]
MLNWFFSCWNECGLLAVGAKNEYLSTQKCTRRYLQIFLKTELFLILVYTFPRHRNGMCSNGSGSRTSPSGKKNRPFLTHFVTNVNCDAQWYKCKFGVTRPPFLDGQLKFLKFHSRSLVP